MTGPKFLVHPDDSWDSWHIIDDDKGAQFRRFPKEHFSVPSRYELRFQDMICICEMDFHFEDKDKYEGPGFYWLTGFYARRDDQGQKPITRKALQKTYEAALPNLERFLKFLHETWASDKVFSIKTELPEDIFWSVKEEHRIRLSRCLEGAQNTIFLLLKWPDLTDEFKEEHGLFLDWLEDFSVDEEVKNLVEDYLMEQSPVEQIKFELFDKYLSQEVSLPEEDVYKEKYFNWLEPYFRVGSED